MLPTMAGLAAQRQARRAADRKKAAKARWVNGPAALGNGLWRQEPSTLSKAAGSRGPAVGDLPASPEELCARYYTDAFDGALDGALGQHSAGHMPANAAAPSATATVAGANFGSLPVGAPPHSVSVQGTDFGASARGSLKIMKTKLNSMLHIVNPGANRVRDMAVDVTDGSEKLLPIWIITVLKVKLDRARAAIQARNEFIRPKNAIRPEAKPKMAWDAMTTILLVYTLFEIPFELGFIESVGCNMSSLDWFNFFVDIVFCMDIAVAFHTGFYVKVRGEDILEDNHWLIAERYLKGWFVVDFVSSIPLERLVCAMSGGGSETELMRIFKVARFMKLARLVRFNRMLNKWQAMSVKKWQLNTTRLFKLVVMMLLVAHMMGCGWEFIRKNHPCGKWNSEVSETRLESFGVIIGERYGCECNPAESEDCDAVNWMAKYDPDLAANGSVTSQYFAGFYYTIIGLATVGFGDISPANDVERLYSIVLTLLGAVVFSVVIGSVGEIAQQGNVFEEALSGAVHLVSDFLEHRNVPDDISVRLVQHLTYASVRAPQHYTSDQLNLMPRAIRKDVMKHLAQEQLGTVVQQLPIFSNMDLELRIRFLLLLRPIHLLDHETLFQALDVGREAYFLLVGELNQWSYTNQFGHMEKNDERISNPGDMVGELALLEDGPAFRFNTIKAYGRAELLELTRDDFQAHVKSDFPDVYQAFIARARTRLIGPGSKEAQMAMRSRSIKRCAMIGRRNTVREKKEASDSKEAGHAEDGDGLLQKAEHAKSDSLGRLDSSPEGQAIQCKMGGAGSHSVEQRLCKLEEAVSEVKALMTDLKTIMSSKH